MKKKQILIGLVAATLAIGTGTGLVITHQKPKYSVSDSEIKENTVVLDNGDYHYKNQEKNIVVSSEENMIYYNNTLEVYLTHELSANEKEKLANSVGGIVVGCSSGNINSVQVMVPDSNISELEEMSQTLMNSESVLYSSYDFPIVIDLGDQNPWEVIKKAEDHNEANHNNNKNNPDGNDWWAESIGAYELWDYVDAFPETRSAVTVGVIDAGIDENHEEFIDANSTTKISFLNGNHVMDMKDADHGTHVTGLISANNNNVGIRGIADNATIVFSAINILEAGENTIAEDNVLELDLSLYTQTLNQMLGTGATVINTSWGLPYLYDQEQYFKKLLQEFEDAKKEMSIWDKIKYGSLIDTTIDDIQEKPETFYQMYLNYHDKCASKSADVCISIIESLISQNNSHILFVQAAGNGYNNTGIEGFNSSRNGFFSAVTEDRYKAFCKDKNTNSYSYQNVKDYILCVSGYNKETPNEIIAGFIYGETVDIVAPGWDIYSTITTIDGGKKNKDKEIYGNMSGTSMAAPIAAGSAAALWSIDPTMTNSDLKALLINNSREGRATNQADSATNYHMLNLGAAVRELIHKKTGIVPINVSDQDGNPLTGYTISMSTESFPDDLFFNYTIENAENDSMDLNALGVCKLEVSKNGYTTEKIELNINPEEKADVIKIVLNEKGTVLFSVVDHNDNPVTNFNIEVSTDTSENSLYNYSMNVSDSNKVELTAIGNSKIKITKEGYEETVLDLEVPAGEVKDLGTIRLKKPAVDIEAFLCSYISGQTEEQLNQNITAGLPANPDIFDLYIDSNGNLCKRFRMYLPTSGTTYYCPYDSFEIEENVLTAHRSYIYYPGGPGYPPSSDYSKAHDDVFEFLEDGNLIVHPDGSNINTTNTWYRSQNLFDSVDKPVVPFDYSQNLSAIPNGRYLFNRNMNGIFDLTNVVIEGDVLIISGNALLVNDNVSEKIGLSNARLGISDSTEYLIVGGDSPAHPVSKEKFKQSFPNIWRSLMGVTITVDNSMCTKIEYNG